MALREMISDALLLLEAMVIEIVVLGGTEIVTEGAIEDLLPGDLRLPENDLLISEILRHEEGLDLP